MHCVEEIKNGIYWMGCNDFRTELFERIFPDSRRRNVQLLFHR